MIRTCRFFLPGRSNYNVSLFNQRSWQGKQTTMDFSFYIEQWKGNYLQKKLFENVKSDFSTFKEHEKLEPERTQEKKLKSESPDYLTFKENKLEKKAQAVQRANIEEISVEFSSVKENLKSQPTINRKIEPLNRNIESFRGNDNLPAFKSEHSIQTDPSLSIRVTPKDAIKGLKVLTKTGKRSTTNLNLLSSVLLLNKDPYDLIECSDILFSFAKLSFAYMPLLHRLSQHISQKLSEEKIIRPKVLISLLQSVCKLRYRNCELIEDLCKHIDDAVLELSTEQITVCLFALSNLNIQSNYVDHFISVLSKLENTDFNKTRNFLNYVWASIILGKQDLLPLKHLEIVLSKSFSEQLAICGENTLINKMKLSNISGVASSIKNYKGPLMDNLIFSPVLSKSKQEFLSTIRDSLSYIFPKIGYIQALSYAGHGVFIDIECCLDSSLNPISLKKKNEKNKVAIMLLGHNDLCLESFEMTGVNAFKIKSLKKQGYKILTINYLEFPFSSTLSTKIAYLRGRFKEILV